MPTEFTVQIQGKMQAGEIYTIGNGVLLGVIKTKGTTATTWQLSKWQIPFWEFGWGTLYGIKAIIGKFKHA